MFIGTKSLVVALSVCIVAGSLFGDDDFFEKSECKKTTFEKRLYYGLEKTEGLSAAQKESINQALKEFQVKKEKQISKNVKKFQSDDIDKSYMSSMANDNGSIGVAARTSLLVGIHKTLTPKQREQFVKKFQGMMD